MNYETVEAAFGHSLRTVTVNFLCRDVVAETAFLQNIFGMAPHRVSADFATMLRGRQPVQLHSDGAYASHPFPPLVPEARPRGQNGRGMQKIPMG